MPTYLTTGSGDDLYRGATHVVVRSQAVSFEEDDYLRAMQALMPRGRAWPEGPDTVQAKLLRGLAASFTTSDAAAKRLLVSAFPRTAGDLAPEWEASLGLPGPAGLADTIEGRRLEIVAALTSTGGQSRAYFTALAAALGITVTIVEFEPSSVEDAVDAPIADPLWAHVWQVNAPLASGRTYVTTADIVQATPGFGNPALEYALGRGKPAHTICVTSYT